VELTRLERKNLVVLGCVEWRGRTDEGKGQKAVLSAGGKMDGKGLERGKQLPVFFVRERTVS
jgi:hypothetical protein